MALTAVPKGAKVDDGAGSSGTTHTITGVPLGTGNIFVFVTGDSNNPGARSCTVGGVTATLVGTSSDDNTFGFYAQGVNVATGNIVIGHGFNWFLEGAIWFLLNGEDPASVSWITPISLMASNGIDPVSITGTIPAGGVGLSCLGATLLGGNTNPATWTNCVTSGNTTLEDFVGTGNLMSIAGNYSTNSGSTTISAASNGVSSYAFRDLEMMMVTFAPLSGAAPAWGLEQNLDMLPPRPTRKASAMFATGPQWSPRPAAQDIPWRNAGWEVQSVQPQHRRSEKFGAIITDEDGTEAGFVPAIVVPKVFEQPAQTFRARPRLSPSMPEQPYKAFPWLNAGSEIQPPPPPSYPKVRQRGAGAVGDSQFASFDLQAFTEVQNWQPRPIRRVQSMIGAEAPFPQTTIPPTIRLYEQVTPTLRARPRLLSTAIISPEQPLIAFRPHGWEIQPFQPPHRRPERGGGAIAEGSDGTDAPFALWRNFGWEVQPPQPPHPRREKFGAIVPKEDGTENIFTFIAVPLVWGFEPSMPLPGRRKVIGFTAEDVIASRFAVFRPFDFDARPAAMLRRDPLRQIEQPGLVVVPPATPAWGWADLPAVLRRASPRFDLGGPALASPRPAGAPPTIGWEIPPVLVQRPRRRPAWALDGDPRAVFIPPVPPPAWEWEFHQPLTALYRVPRAGAVIIPWSGGEIIIPVVPLRPDLCFTANAALWRASSRVSPSCVSDEPSILPNGNVNMGTYEIQTALQIIGTFANSLTGAAEDPTTVTLFLKDPQGTIQTLVYGSSSIVRDVAGQYSFNVTPTIHGVWTYKWQGTGNVVATSPDTSFTVKASTLIAG